MLIDIWVLLYVLCLIEIFYNETFFKVIGMDEIVWGERVDREGVEKRDLGYVNIYRLDIGRRGGKGVWERVVSEVIVMW